MAKKRTTVVFSDEEMRTLEAALNDAIKFTYGLCDETSEFFSDAIKPYRLLKDIGLRFDADRYTQLDDGEFLDVLGVEIVQCRDGSFHLVEKHSDSSP